MGGVLFLFVVVLVIAALGWIVHGALRASRHSPVSRSGSPEDPDELCELLLRAVGAGRLHFFDKGEIRRLLDCEALIRDCEALLDGRKRASHKDRCCDHRAGSDFVLQNKPGPDR